MKTYNYKRDDFDRLLVPSYAPAAFIPVRGKGAKVWDQAGKEYIDFTSGIAVSCLGHCHPELVAALKEQGDQLWHLSNAFTNERVLRLAERLVASTFADKVFFCNSGAEANEAALKLALKVAVDNVGADKTEIVSASQSFHGRTLFTVNVGGQSKYSTPFGVAVPGIKQVPFNDIAALREVISAKTCAVILEPVQGEGGVIPADPDYLKAARAITREHDAVLIFDEVQTGVGRTGQLYAYEHYGVEPDILTSAKGLGGGFPIGAMLTTAALAEHFGPGTHGTTYGGNPLACAVADTVVRLVAQEDFLAGVRARETLFLGALCELSARYGVFAAPRGLGLLIGCPLHDEWRGQAKTLVNLAAEEGVLLLLQAGPDVLRFAPPLNIAQADILEGLARLARALGRIAPPTNP